MVELLSSSCSEYLEFCAEQAPMPHRFYWILLNVLVIAFFVFLRGAWVVAHEDGRRKILRQLLNAKPQEREEKSLALCVEERFYHDYEVFEYMMKNGMRFDRKSLLSICRLCVWKCKGHKGGEPNGGTWLDIIAEHDPTDSRAVGEWDDEDSWRSVTSSGMGDRE